MRTVMRIRTEIVLANDVQTQYAVLRSWAEEMIDECKATVTESYEDNPAETVNRMEQIKDRL